MAFEPLEPGADEARRRLEVELARPEYDQMSPLQRLLRWLEAHLPSPSGHGVNVDVGVVVVVALLLVALALLLWRYRDVRQVAAQRRRRERGLTDPGRSASSYLQEARQHLGEGATDRAVVAAFRALVVSLDDRDVVRDAPGRTAHEVASAAGEAGALGREDASWAAGCFDAACYGHPDGPLPGPDAPQRTTRADAERLLQVAAATQGVPA